MALITSCIEESWDGVVCKTTCRCSVNVDGLHEIFQLCVLKGISSAIS